MDAPFSQCDAKGRCIRHPAVHMSRKKKLGGWKKLLSNCPMCAMELVAEGREELAYCGEVAAPAASSSRRGGPRRGDRLARPSQHSDDRSVDRSTRSAPSAYHRRDSQDSGRSSRSSGSSPSVTKRNISGDSSCDSTVDMSYSSHSSGSHHSSGSRDCRRELRAPRVGHHDDSHDVNTIRQNEEQFVCGMEFERPGSYYTGQVHFESRLPHGLGTLRRADGTVREGEWQYGRLVQESGTATPYLQACQEQEEYACKNYDDYCMPCTGGRPVTHGQANCYEDSLAANFQRQCHFETKEESSVSNSVAETVHDDETGSQSSWSRGSSHSQSSSYSARESKASLPLSTSRATYNKLQEFEQYVIQCDEEEDWYQDDESSRASRTSYSHCSGIVGGDYDNRPRKVRFREDP